MLDAMGIKRIVVESVHFPNTPSHVDQMYEITAYAVAPLDHLEIQRNDGS